MQAMITATMTTATIRLQRTNRVIRIVDGLLAMAALTGLAYLAEACSSSGAESAGDRPPIVELTRAGGEGYADLTVAGVPISVRLGVVRLAPEHEGGEAVVCPTAQLTAAGIQMSGAVPGSPPECCRRIGCLGVQPDPTEGVDPPLATP